jgi:hypothetical protein
VTLTFSLLTGALGIFGTVTLALSLGDFPEGKPSKRQGKDGENQ